MNMTSEKKEVTLRGYQEFAVSQLVTHRNVPGNDLCILATGAGKSLVISNVVHRLKEPVLILQPSLEILLQNVDKMSKYVSKDEIGVYSASAGEKEIQNITFATIGSIYTQPKLFERFKVVIVDEAHLVPVKDLGSMYGSFLKAIGAQKVYGLTATPFRMDTAYKWVDGVLMAEATIRLITSMKPKGVGQKPFWNRILCNVNAADLTSLGYLCPIEYVDKSVISQDDLKLNTSRTDFDPKGVEEALGKKDAEVIEAIRWAIGVSKSVLVFTSSVQKAEFYSSLIENSAVVTAKTPSKERARIIDEFRSGKIKTVLNCQCLTTGFDHPSLDSIVLAKPTRSIALYSQMIGRGVRIAPGKTRCTVLDLTDNVKKIGRFETIKVKQAGGRWILESETRSDWNGQFLYSYKVDTNKKK